MKWTDAQQSAIDAPKPGILDCQTILVSAAAGSGKTAVLVERIIQRLKSRDISIQELMVVTFTKAAAAEMKARIGSKLVEEYQKTQDPYLEEQLNLLSSAHISTLHSFCQWVIRSYFYQLDIDPSFTIGNEGELALLRQDVLDKILLEAYEEGLHYIYDVSDMFGTDRSDMQLREYILQMHSFALAQSQPMAWIDNALAVYEEALTIPLLETPWGQSFWQDQHKLISYLLERYEKAQKLATLGEGFDGWMESISQLQNLLQTMANSDTWDAMHTGIDGLSGFKHPVLRVTKGMQQSDPAILGEIKSILSEGKELVQGMVNGVFAITEADWQEQIRGIYPLLKGVIGLVKVFHERFQEAKQELGMIDFSDLEHLCLALLVDPESKERLAPSVVAKELQQTFKEVMVDEYQDTNGVQEAIVNLVSREDNRFYVGDVKQSIYGFRMADPSLFMEKYHRFSHHVDAVTRRIDLSQNFRSHENILTFTNFIFSQIMTEEGAELNYGEKEALHPGRVVENAPPQWVGGDVEIHVLGCDEVTGDGENEEEDLENEDKEMLFVIEKILSLRESGALVQDKDGSFRPMEWRDIVILKRSISGSANRMIEMMRQKGIPAYAEEKSGYFSAMEVQLVLSILQIIDNPEQDLPMAIVLQSPLVGMDANDLGRLRLFTEGSLWSGLKEFVHKEGRGEWIHFYESLEIWRTMSRRHGVSDVLWDVYKRLHLVEYVSAMTNGIVRRANVLALYERAKQYENGNYRGLFRFLRFIESLQLSGQDLSIAKTVSEADNVVRIMTIHKSKGLEFPVVFLMGTQKRFNTLDLRKSILLHKQFGIGMKGYFTDLRVLYNSLPWLWLKEQLTYQMKAEEERILYVALTRPKDKLFITGFKKGSANGSKQASTYIGEWIGPALQWGESAFSKEMIRSCNSYLDWILLCLARHVEGGTELRHFAEVESPQFPPIPYKDCRVSFHLHDGADYKAPATRVHAENQIVEQLRHQSLVEAPPLEEHLVERLTHRYPHQESTERGAKISVSEIKRRFMLPDELADSMQEEILEPIQDDEIFSFLGQEVLDTIPFPQGSLDDEVIEESSSPQEIIKDLGPFALTLGDEGGDSLYTGPRWGTLMHEAMQWLPVQSYTKETLKEALDDLVLKEYFTEEERKALSERRLLHFFHSDLGKRLTASKRVEKELPFSLLLEAHRIYPHIKEGEELFLQGIIDTVFLEDGAWVLVDYKTDRLDAKGLQERYAIQLGMYKEALERLTPYKVKETYIYSFRLEEAVPL